MLQWHRDERRVVVWVVGRAVRSTQIKWHADQIHNELFLKQLTTDETNASPNNSTTTTEQNEIGSTDGGNWEKDWELELEQAMGRGKGLRLLVEMGLETGMGFVLGLWVAVK